MSNVLGVTVECVDVDRVAEFWRATLGLPTISAPSSGVRVLESGEEDCTVRLSLRRVSARKMTRNRVRLDLGTNDLEVETARLIALGATRIDAPPQDGTATLADVEGNEFELLYAPTS